MATERANQFKILLSDEELEMLRALAEDRGLTASDYVRTNIRTSHETLMTKGTAHGSATKKATASKKARSKK